MCILLLRYSHFSNIKTFMSNLYRYAIRKIPRPVAIRLSYVFRVFAPLLLKGDNVHCPICGHSFKKFLPYGTMYRDNVLCPNCLSLERHRMLWIYLEEHTDFFSAHKRFLHVAPEQCFLDKFRKMKNLDYVTADLESPIADVKMDVHDIPFGDNEFDVIFCNHVLEHVDDALQSMRELYRVLKPGGFAIMQVPLDRTREKTYEDPTITDPLEREKYFWQRDHVRLFGRDYPDWLEKAGFKVEHVDITAELDPLLVERYRLPKGEMLYVGRK